MSQILDNLNFLATNATAIVARNATQALQYQQALDQGQITQSEYIDLMQDLANMLNIADAADDLNNKILLERCISIAISVGGAIYSNLPA